MRQPYVTSPNRWLSSRCAYPRASKRIRNQFVTWAEWSASLQCVAFGSNVTLVQARIKQAWWCDHLEMDWCVLDAFACVRK